MVPVHWGAFSLSRHNWYDPPESVEREASKRDVTVVYPVMGQIIEVDKGWYTETVKWWKEFLPAKQLKE